MREDDILYCTKKYSDGVAFANIGDKWIVDEVFSNTIYIKNSKCEYIFFYMDRLIEYFETVEERRCRLIEDLV